ncbi:hypothetical protein NBRC10513v2_005398 [Rhodotorula toruloides]|uniref:DNA polymerase delta, subunit 4-domain containing protein n=1 Tax=Rhodotorula toruloides TaxID=5286 RepID=A0A2T0A199_RHOTO|nr:DNA polymerase delta, subunit 4-domain containing protein [Rhodotorula toruloides]
MPPKSRSSTSKSASSAKLGFSSSKKGVAGSGKGAKGAVEPATKKVKLERKKSGLEGLYPRLYREAVRKMGPAIHRDEMDDIEIILRVFDADEEYGPCSRINRLERFERAEKLGLQPDPEIGEILRSEEAKNRKEYSESVFQI